MGQRTRCPPPQPKASTLLRLYLCGPKLRVFLLLRLLLRQVVPDDATADGTDNRMVPCIVAGYAADDSAFDAACRIGSSRRGKREQRGQEKSSLTV